MSQTITGLDQYTNTLTAPSAGDPAAAAVIRAALQALLSNDTNLKTENAKQINVVDGGTYTMLGTSVTIQGTPNFHWNVDSFFYETVTFGATGTSEIVSCYSELRVRGDAHLVGQNTTIGSGGTQDLTVYADATFKSNLRAEDDCRLGVDIADNVVVDGSLDVTNPATFQALLTADSLQVNNDSVLGSGASSSVTVNGQFAVTGSSSLGNAGSDSTDITGSLTVTGDATLGNAASDTTTVTGDLNVNENTVLGTNSSDSVTIPASLTVNGPMSLFGALSNALTFTGFGRVPGRSGLVTSAATLNVASGNLFVIPDSVSTGFTVPISDTGAGDGDWMLFMKSAAVPAPISVTFPGISSRTMPGAFNCFLLGVRIGGQWYATIVASA